VVPSAGDAEQLSNASGRAPLQFEEPKRVSWKEFPITTIPSETEILIVGAGPTGLTLSAELRRPGF
jgi:hypothetical protein